jgi:hypothetical protein
MASGSTFLGFDPGGSHNFGVAILDGITATATTVSSIAAAISWATLECGSKTPIAAGIDTMLHWCDGPGRWRPADIRLRAAYPAARSSIISPNGLYGSMGTGGMGLALRLRERWPDIALNETHPKVLAFGIRHERHKDSDPMAAIAWYAEYSGLDLSKLSNHHELDAMLSAWATREGVAHGWGDLVTDDPTLILPAGRVTYLWPDFHALTKVD